MAGLDDWSEGTVALDGVDIGGLGDDARALWRRQHVGFVFQAFHVLPHLDVAQNVALPLMLLQTCMTTPAWRRCSTRWAWVAWARACRNNSAAANSSAWRSPAR